MTMANGNQHEQSSAVDSNDGSDIENASSTVKSKSQQLRVTATDTVQETNDLVNVCTRSTLNDLVADLCLNGSNNCNNRNNYGDYTNIRATADKVSSTSATVTLTSTQPTVQHSATNSTATTSSTFSFKHFLSNSGGVTAPSTTVTLLDAVSTAVTSNTTKITSAAETSTSSLQTSTGARPKVPQSASTSLMQTECGGSNSNASKMKRSPRFSSFDSQASLAEYAATGGGGARPDGVGACALPGKEDDIDDDEVAEMRRSRLYGAQNEQFGDFLPSFNSNLPTTSSRYVPRSYSSYDMPPDASPRRRLRVSITGCREVQRPNRLSFNTIPNAPKMKLDLPLDTTATTNQHQQSHQHQHQHHHQQATLNRLLPNANANPNAGDYAPQAPAAATASAAAAALPDFVQDHWLDSWYGHDMRINSPPSSPHPEFCQDTGLPGPPSNSNSNNATINNNATSNANVEGTAKMLPDFLSDGPIIHSSQRLADVAAGLPSNPMSSPQDTNTAYQLSTLRQENERLQRELNETRTELNAQTRRANDLERQLQQQAIKRTAAQRFRNQVVQMRAELDALDKESESVLHKNEGGDTNTKSYERVQNASSGGATSNSSSASSSNGNQRQPSNARQLARELHRAASTAECNLMQLLAGVDNLRQMATSLESTTQASASPTGLHVDVSEKNSNNEQSNCDDGGDGIGDSCNKSTDASKQNTFDKKH